MKIDLCIRHFQFGCCKAIDEHFINSTSIEMLIHPTASWPLKLIMSSNVLLFFTIRFDQKLYKMGEFILDDTKSMCKQKIFSFSIFLCCFFLLDIVWFIEAFRQLIFYNFLQAILDSEAIGENKMMSTNSFRGKNISVKFSNCQMDEWNCGDMISILFAALLILYLIN